MKLTPLNNWFSTTINYHQKKIRIKASIATRKGIGCKKKKSSVNLKAEWDTNDLPNIAHHFQVYSAAVASADNLPSMKILQSSALQRENQQVTQNPNI
jgi:hypothetical protein